MSWAADRPGPGACVRAHAPGLSPSSDREKTAPMTSTSGMTQVGTAEPVIQRRRFIPWIQSSARTRRLGWWGTPYLFILLPVGFLLLFTYTPVVNMFWYSVTSWDGLSKAVSYTHLRAHETRHDLVCRLLLEKK